MRDKDVSKMLLKILDKSMGRSQSSSPVFPNFSNMRPVSKKKPVPTRAQLKALEEGRKILLMKRKESQK